MTNYHTRIVIEDRVEEIGKTLLKDIKTVGDLIELLKTHKFLDKSLEDIRKEMFDF